MYYSYLVCTLILQKECREGQILVHGILLGDGYQGGKAHHIYVDNSHIDVRTLSYLFYYKPKNQMTASLNIL